MWLGNLGENIYGKKIVTQFHIVKLDKSGEQRPKKIVPQSKLIVILIGYYKIHVTRFVQCLQDSVKKYSHWINTPLYHYCISLKYLANHLWLHSQHVWYGRSMCGLGTSLSAYMSYSL